MQNAPREHSAILSISIKLLSSIKTLVLSIFEMSLKAGFTACTISHNANTIQIELQGDITLAMLIFSPFFPTKHALFNGSSVVQI